MKYKVMPNNSHVKDKKTEVISSISNKTKSVTACNDSLKFKTSNVNAVCATCGKCVFNSNHDACVSKYLNDVNARTKKPKVVPISTRKPKSQANKSVATPPKKTVASESTTQKSKNCSTHPIHFDYGCTKHMTSKLTLLCNFVEKYLGTVRFGNDQFALILGYRDLVQENITINRVYYIKGLNHNLFSVGQFCDADLEVAFRKSMCFVRDLQGNDLLTSNCGSDLYTISLQETTSSTLICLMAKAFPTQAWLWHRRLSHLNFDYINLLSKKDVVIGLPKLKYVKDQLCYSCEVSKAKKKFIQDKADTTVPSQQELDLLFGPLYDEFFNAGTSSVNNSSSPTDNSKQQDTPPITNIQSSTEPTTPTNVNAEENNDNQEEDTQFQQDEFINPFCTPVREIAESSSRNIDNSNMNTFYQPHDSEYRWTKDHPLEQVRGHPS
ncbi:retrovirus-related pol polyprotein from transposon TNT 1-94 [Tanacetum coccineum]